MNSTNLKVVLMGLAITASAAACGADDKGDGESINAVSARQALTGNTEGVASKVSKALLFLESSKLANRGFNLGIGSSVACDAAPVDGSGADFDSGSCADPSAPVEPASLDVDLSSQSADLTQYLEEKIFADANIETSSDTQVTFLLRGSVVCDADPFDGSADQGCIDQVDNAQVRLKVTSPAAGDVDVAVLIGAQKHNPLSIEVHQSLIAAEIDLAGIKGAITTLSNGELDPSLPTTMTGRIRGEVEVLGTDKARAAVSILSAINVSGGDYAVTLAASSPAFEITADGTAKTLVALTNLGAMHATGPYTTETYDDVTGDFSEVSQVLDIAIAGLSAQMDFAGSSDTLNLSNLGLGDATSVIKLDGAQLLGIDLNADAGRKFAASIANVDDITTIIVDPKFDLKVAMDFSSLSNNQDMPAWAMGDILHVALDGTTPTLRFTCDSSTFEVVSGNLEMSLMTAGDSITVAAGQCLTVESNDAPVIDRGTEPAPDPVAEGPFASMIAGECAM
jgi:hypothetical protein